MKYWKIIVGVLIFMGAQITAGFVGALLALDKSSLKHAAEGGKPQLPPEILAILTVISGIIAIIIICFALKTINLKAALTPSGITRGRNWLAGLTAVVGCICGFFAIDILSDMVVLPDTMQSTFLGMSQSTVAIVCISILGPIIEELLFRESIEGYMLRNGARPWHAIGVSALLFGLIHLNPTQVAFAIPAGILLGVVYWQTRNVWLCSIIHILNNSLAMLEMAIFGEKIKEMSYTEMIGGTGPAIGSIVGGIVACVLLLTVFCKLYKR